MKRLGDWLALALILLCLSLCGCKPKQILVEKTRVDTRTEYVMDTLVVAIPAQSVSVDTSRGESHLETDYAESDAWINDDGTLHHDLRNKAGDMGFAFDKPIIHRDSIVEKPVPYEVPVLVDKPPTTWQKVQMKGFWILSFFIFGLIFICCKCPWLVRKILP